MRIDGQPSPPHLKSDLSGGEPCLKIDNHAFKHIEYFRSARELTNLTENDESPHAVKDERVISARSLGEQFTG